MATTFDQYIAGESRAQFISMLRLRDENEFLLRLDVIYGRLDTATKIIDEDRKHIRFLQDLAHVKLFTAALAYIRGQRADSFGLARSGIEAGINAYLLHKGIITPNAFEDGGRIILDVYRTIVNKQHPNYRPELGQLLDIRSKLSRWGAHSEYSAYAFRLSQDGDQAFFSFFDAAEDPKEFRFYFVAIVSMFVDAAEVFCVIAHDRGERWATEIGAELHKLKADTEAHVRKLGYLKGYPEEGPKDSEKRA